MTSHGKKHLPPRASLVLYCYSYLMEKFLLQSICLGLWSSILQLYIFVVKFILGNFVDIILLLVNSSPFSFLCYRTGLKLYNWKLDGSVPLICTNSTIYWSVKTTYACEVKRKGRSLLCGTICLYVRMLVIFHSLYSGTFR